MRTVPSALLLLGVILCPLAAAQDCPPLLPLTHAPIEGLDGNTVVLGSFETGMSMTTPMGPNLVTSTDVTVPGAGIFGSTALSISGPGASIWRTKDINPTTGTIEFWLKPGPDTTSRQVLFSLRGRKTLNNDGWTDLFVGEPTDGVLPADSKIYFGTPFGLDMGNPAIIETVVPRGVGVADFDQDGSLDLAIANNQAPTPAANPGAVYFFDGPILPGSVHTTPDEEANIDLAQGLTVADFDGIDGPDIVAASYASGTLAVYGWINDGTGALRFDFAPPSLDFITAAEGTAVGDVNGDGVLDVLYGAFSSDSSYVLIGDLLADKYTFDIGVGVSSPRADQSLGVSLGDLNGDGHLDCALAQPLYDNGVGVPTGQVAIHFNDGTGLFNATPDHVVTTPRPFTVNAEKDINNDGHLDLLVANWRDGVTTSPASRAVLGPFPPVGGASPELEFLVDDAVSMTVADLDADGIEDVFFRSSTDTESPVFLLQADGSSRAGIDAQGRQLPVFQIPTGPTVGNPGGEGAGVLGVNVGGTMAYGSHLDRSNSFEIAVENDQLVFSIVDRVGGVHSVTAPLPDPAVHEDAVDGFVHLQAGWWGAAGLIEMRVGHPDDPAELYRTLEPSSWFVGSVAPVYQLGADPENRFRADGWMFDDFRISDVRRTTQDGDFDGIQDEWDNCPATANASQADGDGDGLGDDCLVCQPDLGFGGPGTMTIGLCGQALCIGSGAVFTVAGGPPFTQAWMLMGLDANPTPFKGGTLVPLPIVAMLPLPLDGLGGLAIPVPGGSSVGPLDVYVQLGAQDGSQPKGVVLSNVLRVEFPE
jgi:hypothetical protein